MAGGGRGVKGPKWNIGLIAGLAVGLGALRLFGADAVVLLRKSSSVFDAVAETPNTLWKKILANPRTADKAGQLNFVILVSTFPFHHPCKFGPRPSLTHMRSAFWSLRSQFICSVFWITSS